MKLINIDKARYRRHLTRVMWGCALSLAVLSLVSSQLLIALFPDASGSHFHWNAIGVLGSALFIGLMLSKYREHPYLTEVVYVWELKKSLNKIARKLRKIEAAAKQGDIDAMLALQYSYAGSRLLWQLDDNMIVSDELAIKQTELNNLAEQFNVTLDADDYHESLLDKF